jgi:hypothetical protein
LSSILNKSLIEIAFSLPGSSVFEVSFQVVSSANKVNKMTADSNEKKPVQRPKLFFMRNLLINRSCQIQLLIFNALTIVVTGGFFALLTLSMLGDESIQPTFYWGLTLGFAIFLLVFFVGLWVSNRIAGPIYRLEMHMNSLINGEPVTELKFRAGDQFQTTAELYNQLIKHYETRDRQR